MDKEHKKVTRIIVMLGARMKKVSNGNKFKWEFPLINERYGKKFGNLPVEAGGGDARLKAISIIYKNYLKNKKLAKICLYLQLEAGKNLAIRGHIRRIINL